MATPGKKDQLNITSVTHHKNILQIPIYCLGVYRHFAIIGGGGGNEIENKLMVFDVKDSS